MSVTKVISLNGTALTEIVPATTSAGAGSAGQIVALNSSGLVDATMLPSSGSSSGPSMIVPRDINWHIAIAYPEATEMVPLGMYLGNSVGQSGFNQSPDAAGYQSIVYATGTTANTCCGIASPHLCIAKNPSFRAAYCLTSATNVQCYVGMISYGNVNMAGVSDLPSSGVAFCGFRYFSATDGGNWVAYCGSYSAAASVDTGVAVNTTQVQVFDVIWVAGAPQFFIDGVRVAASLPTTDLMDSTYQICAVGIHMNTTTTAVASNVAQLYIGSN